MNEKKLDLSEKLPFAQLIRRERKRMNLTQEEFAKRIGISRGAYSQYEAGNRKPKPETMKKILSAFITNADKPQNTDIDEFLYYEGITKRHLDEWEEALLDDFNMLTDSAQKKVMDYVNDLTKIEEYRIDSSIT